MQEPRAWSDGISPPIFSVTLVAFLIAVCVFQSFIVFWTVTVFVGSDISASKNEAVVCFKLNVPVAPLVS